MIPDTPPLRVVGMPTRCEHKCGWVINRTNRTLTCEQCGAILDAWTYLEVIGTQVQDSLRLVNKIISKWRAEQEDTVIRAKRREASKAPETSLPAIRRSIVCAMVRQAVYKARSVNPYGHSLTSVSGPEITMLDEESLRLVQEWAAPTVTLRLSGAEGLSIYDGPDKATLSRMPADARGDGWVADTIPLKLAGLMEGGEG